MFAFGCDAGVAGRSARLVDQHYPLLRQGRVCDAWVDADYSPVFTERGEVGGVLWTLRDVTGQVKVRSGPARQWHGASGPDRGVGLGGLGD